MRAFKGEKITVDDLEIHKNNQIIPLEISANPIYNRDGEIVYAIAIFQDITQRKQLEMERIKLAQKEALLQQLNFLANYDSLTKISNRRRCDEYIKQEWQRMAWEKQPISLIICNIDNLKEYNDRHGDRITDYYLVEVAKTIRTAVEHPGYLVARYNSKKFVLVMPNTELERAINVGEKIRQAVKDLELDFLRSDSEQHLTISLGISTIVPTLEFSYKTLISNADRALDRAVELGGDRVCD